MRRIPLLTLALLCLAAAPALADWDPGMPAKWIQLPDLSTTGIDVNCMPSAQFFDYILADDFQCTETGLITGIHIWGSWFGDFIPDPTNVAFTLSLHADIPADPAAGVDYSMPGEMLWAMYFQPADFAVRPFAQDLPEGWLDPPENYIFPADYVCWQYNFAIPEEMAFLQEGTADEPVVYWLDVKAYPIIPETQFGWKTSLDHWNDDAVWGDGPEPYQGPWYELRYPFGHEMAGQSIDLAFVIDGEPVPEGEDWGDAPDGAAAPGYPTLMGNNGARHTIDGVLYLGAGVDPEANGQPDPVALGDDNDGNDDEDGVTFTSPLIPGMMASVDIVASAPGLIDAWIDFGADQSWNEPGDMIMGGAPVGAGTQTLGFLVPASALVGAQTFARFRISNAGGLAPGGAAPDGEVEDYEVVIEDARLMKWLQRPDLDVTGIDVCAVPAERDYLLADDFECRQTGPLTDFVIWGSWLDDYLPFADDPAAVVFTLSIHKDIPVGEMGNDYSMPGEVLWHRDFGSGEFRVDLFAEQIEEGFMFPPDGYTFPADWTCWRYQFHVDPHMAFIQEGEEDAPVVYWLDLKAHPLDPMAYFGWKTSLEHWNDDAVWGEGLEPYPGPWFELRYPANHPFEMQSIDLAFAILEDPVTAVPDPETLQRTGLRGNVPNPFNPGTEILFEMPAGGGPARLEIFDARGRLVRLLVDGHRAEGLQRVFWDGLGADGRPQPGGVYFGRLNVQGETRTLKMMLVR